MIKISRVKSIEISSIKFIDGNREINESHVQKMYNLINENGFADTIKVAEHNNEFYCLEGQHRIEALKLHKVKEVPCSVIDWLGYDFEEIQQYVIDLNAHNKQWNLYDYTKSWADKKIYQYVHLRNQMISYQKTLSNGVVATCYDGVVRSHPNLKNGKLSFVNQSFSDDLTETLSKMVAKYGKTKLPAQVLRNAAQMIVNFKEDKYKLLQSFQRAAANHIATSKEPLADGDEGFKYWFKNVVFSYYNND